MYKDSKIYVAGHTGLLGSALINRLNEYGYSLVITKSHSELDLTNKAEVFDFFSIEKPEYVFLAAGICHYFCRILPVTVANIMTAAALSKETFSEGGSSSTNQPS